MADANFRTITIYSLSSSQDGVARYVGQTSSALARRLYAHKSEAIKGKCRKSGWIRQVIDSGFTVVIQPIKLNATKHMDEIEEIRKHRESGFDLLNESGGGGGNSNPSDATRKKLSESVTARFTKHSEREKTSICTAAGMQTAAVREKIKKSAKARWSIEANRKTQSEIVSARFSSLNERADQAERRAKMTNNQVIEARNLRRSGASLKELCSKFNLSKPAMSVLCRGKTFKHLAM